MTGPVFPADPDRAPFTILVNTSDGYEDCWAPFFELLARYWPDHPAPVLLNTETRDWTCEKVSVTCAKTGAATETGERPAWSLCLLRALDSIKTPLVLYLQEDYFIHAPVRDQVIRQLAQLMAETPSIAHIGLTHFGSLEPFHPTEYPHLLAISQGSRYRISTQAGLWRKDVLSSYLRAEESAWMFELFGTLRARRRRDVFLTVDREHFGPGERVVDYLHTGIIKGRWHPDQPAILERNGIHLDYAKRGMYRFPSTLSRKLETARKLLASPRALANTLLERYRG